MRSGRARSESSRPSSDALDATLRRGLCRARRATSRLTLGRIGAAGARHGASGRFNRLAAMDFDLTSEQQQIRKLAKDFADREIAPGARERDRSETFPKDVLSKMAPLGLLGGPVPEQYGGIGAAGARHGASGRFNRLAAMDFDLTSEQQQIRKLAKDFADREIAPGARERDRSETFPKDVLSKMAPLGLLGGPVPEQYGGM